MALTLTLLMEPRHLLELFKVKVVESLLARDDFDPNIVGHGGEHALGYAASRG
jgi:hypothetical protein